MATENFVSLAQVSPLLTNENVNKALTDWFGEECTFTHWQYVCEMGKGESFLSELMRIKIYGNTAEGEKHVQVVLKTIPKNVARRLTYRSDQFFRNEINFYQIVLPALLKFQAKKNIKDPFRQYVRLFLAHADGVNDVICLEDASLDNYSTAVRQEGVEFIYCKIAFKGLAQFHAMSFAMRDQEPAKFEEISKIPFETYYADHLWDWYEKFWKRICGIAIDAVEREYPNTIYVEKIKKFAVPETYGDMIKAVKTVETGVISHGDCWTNNFLYKFENNEPVDAKLIDFQLTRCASPVLDVIFFIYACTVQEMRQKYYDKLLNYYYEVLSSQIRDMGSDPNKVYSKDLFLSEVKKYAYFGLAFSFESTPMIVLGPEDELDMNLLQGDKKMNIDDFWQIQNFKTKEGRLREANNVVHCVDHGYI